MTVFISNKTSRFINLYLNLDARGEGDTWHRPIPPAVIEISHPNQAPIQLVWILAKVEISLSCVGCHYGPVQIGFVEIAPGLGWLLALPG